MKENSVTTDTMMALNRLFFLFCMAITIYVMTAFPADAQALGQSVVTAFNNIALTAGRMLPSLGTLAIISLGIGAMFGRITWGQAIIVAVGIAIATTAGDVYNSIAPR